MLLIIDGYIIICDNENYAQMYTWQNQEWGQRDKLGIRISWKLLEWFMEILLVIIIKMVELNLSKMEYLLWSPKLYKGT